jgi:ABC-type branched-subunit amino acid transport system ATPase component/branched-subunit amino acid ABC-type transport system permease component
VQQFLILLISGLVTGALYSLVAAGLTLTYSATGIFNFSYGAVAYLCGYLFYMLHTGLHWNALVAAGLVVLVIAPTLGLILDAAIFRPLARTSDAAKIMATVGLLIALPALTRFVADRIIDISDTSVPTSNDIAQISFPAGIGPVPAKEWTLFAGGTINSDQVIVFATAAVAAVVLWFLVRRTPVGLQMRAVVDRPSLASLRGVNTVMTSRVAWSVGMVLAALAGVVAAPIVGSVQTSPFLTLVFIGSAAAVFGGLKSIPIAFAGGLVLGVAQNMAAAYLTFANDIVGFGTAVPFILLLATLLVLNQDRGRRAGSVSEDVRPLDYLAHLSPLRRRVPWALATVALVAYIVFLANQFWLGVVGTGLALSIIFLSFVVVTGLGGMVNLAQAAFVNGAGLMAGLLTAHYGWPFLPALLVGVLASVILGVVVALPALRLGGLYLALATLALGFILDNVLFGWRWFTNGPNGWKVHPPALGPIDLADRRSMAIVLLVIVLLTVRIIHNLQNSATGRRVTAVRSSSVAAATSAVSPIGAKLVVFAMSAAIAAVGGVMLASLQGNVTGTSKVTVDGLLWLATVVLFGIRRPGAAVVAGIVSAVFPEILRGGIHLGSWGWNGTTSVEIPAILFGLGAVTLARSPDGILADMAEKRFKKRLARAVRASGDSPDKVVQVAAQEELEIVRDVHEHADALIAQGIVAKDLDTESAIAARATEAALEVSNLAVGYGQVQVLHGVSLSLVPGQIVGMFGANGSGKSTLVATCAGDLRPTSGSVRWNGGDITALPTRRRADLGLLVAPESRGIFPGLTVDENLRITLPDRESREKVYDRFPVLRDRRRIPTGNLSGGEQQILTLAPFMANPPKVLIADEPTLGLAPLIVEQITQIFADLRDLGVAILLVEEKTAAVLPVADWVAVLELGHIVWQGPAAATDHDKLSAAYFGEAAAQAPQPPSTQRPPTQRPSAAPAVP